MNQFIAVALTVCEKMEIADVKSRGIIMRFCKLYSPDKIGMIIQKAQSYNWWRNKPIVAFMKAVGEINKGEKNVI